MAGSARPPGASPSPPPPRDGRAARRAGHGHKRHVGARVRRRGLGRWGYVTLVTQESANAAPMITISDKPVPISGSAAVDTFISAVDADGGPSSSISSTMRRQRPTAATSRPIACGPIPHTYVDVAAADLAGVGCVAAQYQAPRLMSVRGSDGAAWSTSRPLLPRHGQALVRVVVVLPFGGTRMVCGGPISWAGSTMPSIVAAAVRLRFFALLNIYLTLIVFVLGRHPPWSTITAQVRSASGSPQ